MQTPSVVVILNPAPSLSTARTSTFSRIGAIHLSLERLEIIEDLLLHHEPIRVRPVIGVPGQLALPIGRDEAKGVPSLFAPLVHGGLLFEHDVIEPGAAQPIAGGEASLTASDHDGAIVRCSVRVHRSTSLRKRLQRTVASGSLLETRGGGFDGRKLAKREAAWAAVFGLHAIGCDLERRAAALEEIRNGVSLALAENNP